MIVIYIILLLVSLLFYIQYEGAFSFYLFCFAAAYPIVFGALMLRVKHKLRIYFESAEQSAPKGSSVPVNIIIDNDSRLPVPNCDIIVRYRTEHGGRADVFRIHTPIFPNNTQVLTVRLSYRHYGTLSVELAKIRIFDMLRVIRFRIRVKGDRSISRVTVFPDHIPIENRINDYSELGLESEAYSKSKKGDDPSEIFDVRCYNEGDKISRIHWKLSAKQDEMMVKDYSLPITNGVLITADFSQLPSGSDGLDKADALIDAAAAVSLHLSEHETAHTLLWCSDNPDGYRTGKADSFESYTMTVRELVNDGTKSYAGSPADVIAGLSTGSAKYAHIIFLTSGFTDEMKQKLEDSGYAYRYTVLDTEIGAGQSYSDGGFVYAPLSVNAVAESLEDIAI